MYSRARLSPASAFAAEDWRVCRTRLEASIVRWTWVSMKPGLTVRSERSITVAPPAGLPTGRFLQSGCLRQGSRPGRSAYRRDRRTIGRIPERLVLISEPLCVNVLPFVRRGRVRMVRFAGRRKAPAPSNSHEPEPKAEDRAGDRHRGSREPQGCADHHNASTSKGGDWRKDRRAIRWEPRSVVHRGSCLRRSRSACQGTLP